MGKIVRNGEEFAGSSNSAENIMYDATKNVKEAIDETKNEVSELNSNLNVHYNDKTDTIQIYYNGEWVSVLNCNQSITSLIPVMTNTSTSLMQNILVRNINSDITTTTNTSPYTSFDNYLLSDSSSYGCCAAGGVNNAALGYKFDNKTNVQKAILWMAIGRSFEITYTLQYSDDNSSWYNAGSISASGGGNYTIDSTEAESHRYWRVFISSNNTLSISGQYACHIAELQFWGKTVIG